MKRKTREKWASAVLLLPAVLLFLSLIIYPVLETIKLSFVKWKGIAGSPKVFVGLENYMKVFGSSDFRNAMLNSFYFMVGGFLILMPLSFGLALLVTSKMKFRRFLKTAYFMPVMLSTTAVALIWVYILNPGFGAVNQLLDMMGASDLKRDWLTTPVLNVCCVVLVNEWMYAGYNMLIFSAGIVAIPDYIYDAASIDGCTGWQRIWHVILPMTKESFKIFSVLCVTGCLKVFDLIWAMTKGGPNNVSSTPAIMLYTEAFTYKNFGKSSAVGVVLLVLGIILSLGINRGLKGEEE